MDGAFKRTLKKFVPDSLVRATRPLRLYLRPQRRFDRRFAVDTCAIIAPDQLGVEGPSREHASAYEATPPSVFARLMKSVELDHRQYVFLDLGSGKGAALLYASEFPFKQIIGVEFSPRLHRIAERNIASFRRIATNGRNVKSVCMDVTAYSLPPEPTVLFLFNPFRGKVLDAVVANLRRSLAEHPRDVVLIYYHPLSRYPAWDGTDFLQTTLRRASHTLYRSRP